MQQLTGSAGEIRSLAEKQTAQPPDTARSWKTAVWPLWRMMIGWLGPDVLVPFVVTRLAIVVVAEVASLTIPYTLGRDPAPPPISIAWDAPLLRLDAGWYLDIAQNWYHFDPTLNPNIQQSVVFFPVYPALVRVFNALFGGGAASSFPASGLIVANLSAVLGLAVLYSLVRREFSAADAQRTVWYMLAFPVSFVLSAAYAEPTFLLACVVSIYAARRQNWLLAGLAATAVTLSRPYGLLIVAPLALEYARTRWRSPRALLDWRGLALRVLPCVGLAAWMVYLFQLSGDPLVFVHLQAAWDNQKVSSPLDMLLTGYGRTRDQQLQGRLDIGSLQFVVAALAVVTTLISWRTLPVIYAAFATVFCLVILSGGSYVSIWRHVYLIFPLFMVAARAGKFGVFDRTYLSLSLVGSGLMVILLATNWAMVS